MGKTKVTGFWTFFCNPKYWSVDQFLQNISEGFQSQYRIASWQKSYFLPGQMGVIRVGKDLRTRAQLKDAKRMEPGVYAAVEIIGTPYHDKNGGFKIEGEKDASMRFNVPIRYVRNYISSPVLFENLLDDFIISQDPYLLKGLQAASMPLLEDTFDRILLYGEEAVQAGNLKESANQNSSSILF